MNQQMDLLDIVDTDAKERRQDPDAFAKRLRSGPCSYLTMLGLGLIAHREGTTRSTFIAWLGELGIPVEAARIWAQVAKRLNAQSLTEQQERQILRLLGITNPTVAKSVLAVVTGLAENVA